MKVLHVNAGLESGGGLTHIINLLKEAKSEKKDFTLLCLADGPVAKAAQEAKINYHVLGVKSRYDLTSLRRLCDFINHGNFDIVHTHGPRANLYLSLIKGRIKAKWCVTVHSNPYLDFKERGFIGKVFTRENIRALKKADCIFAVTKRFAHLITTKTGVSADKVHVIYNGTFFHDDSAIPAKYEHPHFNIVNVARLEKVKGQELLLQALKKLDNGNVHLYIAGDGTQRRSLQELTQKLGLSPQVIFQGFMTHKQLKHLYRRMDLAVLTSYSESFPLVLLEASDNLLPILSTDVGDMDKMIPDKRHGFIANVGDLASIVAALQAAVNTPKEELKQMAFREKAYVADNFSLNKQLSSILSVYRSLMKGD